MASLSTAIENHSLPKLVIGCGYLGQPVAQAWRKIGHRVVALTRSRVETLSDFGLTPLLGDITASVAEIDFPRASTVLYAVGYDRTQAKSMREVYVHALDNVLKRLPKPDRFIYISSTSVYGQTSGEWVDEQSETIPIDESGRICLEAEEVVRSHIPEAMILRFAGIYGPGRLMRQTDIRQGKQLVIDPDKWLNLIHVQDGVAAILAAEQSGSPGEVYLISDGHPIKRHDFYSFLAQQLQAPPIQFAPFLPLASQKAETNRRISNRKSIERLGLSPVYPSFREGVPDSLQTES